VDFSLKAHASHRRRGRRVCQLHYHTPFMLLAGALNSMKMGACCPGPITSARSRGITFVVVLVVVLGSCIVDDEDDDKNDFQERPLLQFKRKLK